MGWSTMKPWVKREILMVGIVLVAFIALMIVLLVNKEPEMVCPTPYILVGTNCCLDNNTNNICDQDEVQAQPNKVTGGFAAEPEPEEEIEEIEAPTPTFEVHIRFKQGTTYNVVDGAELTYTGTTEMPDLTLQIKNLESEPIRCDVNQYHAGTLIQSSISKNVKVTSLEPKTIIMRGIDSSYGESYKVEEEVLCSYEDTEDKRTEKVYLKVAFKQPVNVYRNATD